jgi:NADH:ubiquinone oxidoreductase subunit F (NADH-binding)
MAAGRVVNRWTEVIPGSAELICLELMRPPGNWNIDTVDAEPFFAGQRRILLASSGIHDPENLDDSLSRGAYSALEAALTRRPEEILEVVERAGLRGMGGAFFPTARKWRAAALEPGPRYLVVNAEEGEPGVFKDRHLLEDDPHRLIEGALISAYAIGVGQVYVYVNGQAHLSSYRVGRALEAAHEHRLVGDGVLGSGFSCEVEMREGGGGYVLGEESVILESIEGRRPEPRFRPPQVVEYGLWGHPTVIDNVETLSRVPAIISGWLGFGAGISPTEVARTKLVCVTGDVQRPGVVEVPFGTTIREIVVNMAGGPLDGRALKAVLTAGPSGKIVPPALFDRPLQPGDAEVLLGSGNLIALDERRSLLDVARRLARFNADESCGKCTPCREGASRLAKMIAGSADSESLKSISHELLEIGDVVTSASLCGLGRMAANPILSTLEHFSPAQIFETRRS